MILLRNPGRSRTCLFSLRSYRPVVVGRVITSPISTTTSTSIEDPHTVPTIDPLDSHILASLRHILSLPLLPRDVSRLRHTPTITSLYEMYDQYRSNAHRILEDFVLVTEEHPRGDRRAVAISSSDPGSVDGLPKPGTNSEEGDGTVLVVHAMLKRHSDRTSGIEDLQIDKMSVCSGFVLNVRPSLVGIDNNSEAKAINREEDGRAEVERGEGAFVMTCAHTLEEMYRHLPHPHPPSARTPTPESNTSLETERPISMSFILTSSGLSIPLESCLSSIPRSDLALFRARHTSNKPEKRLRLKSLPITPYPVPIGQQIGVHLFSGLDDGEPVVKLNKRHSLVEGGGSDRDRVQRTSSWIGGRAYKRWGVGEMLGYRSYTGQEVEAGSSHTLPHLQVSPLPTPGSSGGPIIRLDTGTVVGLVSGRRSDNRVEGERGWGAAAEGIFEVSSGGNLGRPEEI
ncbi:hypothetical protein HD553DRAFT_119553 [Filobasidium floriforme]|uniref:uncharacterized protein n=1 Tax=Filobasidium floriforme TaxID=5210 RepID=UPI001E8EF3DF|nr:uncharacterized protein HD553DRAFT_119553 [Filobasidium floriforme]KAH8080111.1 hypothetical protein HD553DRAFT_119553 [Filobasidium floriforme]